MKKSLIALLGILAALMGLGIGILAARMSRTTTARAASLGHGIASSIAKAANKSSGGGESAVIRFASNPQPVPPFLGKDLDGNIVSTAQWPGKVVIVNFWATWCPPCREEIPILIDLASKYKDGLQVIGVSLDDGPIEDVKAFANMAGINYPIVMRSRELVAAYGGVPALPTSYVVNKEARIVQKHEGLFPPAVYEREIRALLGLPVDARIETFEDTGQIFLKNAARATSLPDVDFTGLTPDQKTAALKRLNTEICNCGCGLTLAQCRINDTTCPVSKLLAASVVKEILSGSKSSPTAAAPAAPLPNQ